MSHRTAPASLGLKALHIEFASRQQGQRDAAAAAGDDPLALTLYTRAEPLAPREAWPRLEQCCLRLEDYKMAYYYACKQR